MTKVVLTLIIGLLSGDAIPAQPKAVVAILDTGLSLSDPRFSRFLCPASMHRDFTGKGIADTHGHGTHVTGIITKWSDPKNFCIVIVKYTTGKNTDIHQYEEGIHYLRALRPAFVNMSLNGDVFMEEEDLLVRENPKSKFIVSAGNENSDMRLEKQYPAELSTKYENVIPVGALNYNGYKTKSSNYGHPKMIWRNGEDVLSTLPNGKSGVMSGTSQAAAALTAEYVRAL